MEQRQIIFIDDSQLELLAEMIVARIGKHGNLQPDKWMDIEDVMMTLRIKSRSTIQDLRNRGELRFCKINSKTILYDRSSVNEYIQKHIKEKF